MADAADDAHRHRGTRAIQRMVEYAPSTGGLALWVRHRDRPDEADAAAVAQGGAATRLGPDQNSRPQADRNAGPHSASAVHRPPVIATDGHTVFYGAAFEELSLAAQTGLVAHEVLHIALRHPQRLVDLRQRLGDVDLQLFTVCADAIVNSALAHLAWLQLPPGAVMLERLLAGTLGGQHGAEAALLEWDVERLYRAIDDRRPAVAEGHRPLREARGAAQGGGAQAGGAPSGRVGPGGGGGTAGPSASQSAGQTAARSAGRATGDAPRESAPGGTRPGEPSASAHRSDGPRAAAARSLGGSAVADLLPGPPTADDPQAQADQAREWSERIQRAHAGDGAHSMLRALVADLPRTRTPWEQVLRTQLTRSLSARLELSWSRPSRSYLANQGRCGPHRRMPFEPGLSPARAAPRLVVVVDVSGSIDDALMDRFAAEIEAITRRLESGVTLVIGDQQVRRVQRFEPGRCDLRAIQFHGGGGTDFTPMLEEADRHDPDLTVVLTDLEGPARYRPRAPVLWAVPEAQASAVQPFGRKLTLS